MLELVKWIPPIPLEGPCKPDDVADRVAKRNPRAYDGKYDELEEWIRAMEKIFVVDEVPKDKKVNIEIFCLIGEVDIWRNTSKHK